MLDLTAFPLVRLDVARRNEAGGNAAFMAEMDALLAAGAPFVIVSEGAEPEEPPEATQARGRWYRSRHDALAATCRGMAHVEPDPARRAVLEAQMGKLARAFPVPVAVLPDAATAEAWAALRLAEVPPAPP